jgi:hypothetical protein
MRNAGSPIWLQSSNDVDYARGPVQDDALERIYYTGETQPRMTYIGLVEDDNGCPPGDGFRILGVPAPAGAPDVESDTSIVNPSSGGKLVATARSGSTNRIMTSEDGVNWEVQSTPNRSWLDAAWSPVLGLWVAVGNGNGGVGDIITSPDGAIWTERSTGIADVLEWRGVVWASGLGLFVAVGGTQLSNSGGRIATSPDGITWTQRTHDDGDTSFSTWIGLDYDEGNDLLVAVGGGTAAYSSNGTSWTIVTGIADETWLEAAYAPALDLWVAVGGLQDTSPIATSDDGGQSWTSRSSAAATTLISVAWSEDLGLFAAVGLNGATETSPDGITWTARTAPAANDWFGVIWATSLGIFVGVSRDGTNDRVMTSTDGVTWLPQVEAAAIQWQGVAFGTTAGTETTLDFDPRVYVYTYVTGLGEEGPPSPASELVNATENATLTIDNFTAPPALPEYNITHVRIYRSSVGTDTTEFQFVAEVLVSTGTYDDSLDDSELGEILQTTTWEPPPTGLRGIVALPNGALAGFVGKTVHFSEPYYPHAWPPEYKQAVAHDIVGLGVLPNGVATLTRGTPYAIVGDHPRDMSQTHYQFSQACVSKRSIVNTINSVIYASPDGLCEIGSGGFKVLTRPYATKREWQEYNPTTMKGFWHDSKYFGFYDEGGIIFDPYDESIGFTTLTTLVQAGFVEPETDTLYIVKIVFTPVIAAVGDTPAETDLVMTSPDGEVWTQRTIFAARWSSIAYSPALALFAAVGRDNEDDIVAWSTDGVVWTQGSIEGGGNPFLSREVIWAADWALFIATGTSTFGGNQDVMYSSDGKTWTASAVAFLSIGICVEYSPTLGVAIAIDDDAAENFNIFSSSDGTIWSGTGESFGGSSQPNAIAWSEELQLFAAVTANGNFYTSPTGLSWTQRQSITGTWNDMCWSEERGLFVAVASGGTNRVATSDDGLTWTPQTAAAAQQWQGVCYSDAHNLFVAVANSGTNRVMTSPDGITWELQTTGFGETWTAVAAGTVVQAEFISSWDTGPTNMLTTWKSGKLVAPYPMNLGAGRLVADSYPVTLTIWNDEGDQVASKEVNSDEVFRLPGGYLSDWFELQVANDDVVSMLHVAETVEELLQG